MPPAISNRLAIKTRRSRILLEPRDEWQIMRLAPSQNCPLPAFYDRPAAFCLAPFPNWQLKAPCCSSAAAAASAVGHQNWGGIDAKQLPHNDFLLIATFTSRFIIGRRWEPPRSIRVGGDSSETKSTHCDPHEPIDLLGHL